MPEINPVSKEALDRIDAKFTAEIREINKHIKENGEAIVKLETLYSTLVKLPDAISALEKTVVGVNHNLETMSDRIKQINESVQAQRESVKALREENQRQNETISKVDNKSKIDWSEFITKNFWSIILKAIIAIAAILVAYKTLSGI